MSQVADLYSVLGVAEDADADAIKKAFRALAKKHHPDNNPGDKKAEERFKEVSQAYEILSDPAKRRRYDAMRRSPFGPAPGQGQPFEFQGDLGSINDIFEMFFGRAGSPFGAAGGPGPVFGGGRDLESEVWVDFEDAALGRPITVNVAGQEQPLRLNLPAAAEDGLRLRLAGQGQKGRRGGRGDLYLTLRVKPSPRFRREGLDIVSPVKVNLAQALLGATVTAPTLEGSVRVKLPAGTQPGTRLRLAGQGLRSALGQGDQLVEVDVELPRDLSPQERSDAEAMAKRRGWPL